MRVRVYDKLADSYFHSEVYAIINTGWYEKHLVLVPSPNGNYMKFYDYLDKSDNGNIPTVLINTIVSEHPTGWIYVRSDSVDTLLTEYQQRLSQLETRFFEYMGFSWLYENKEVLSKLLLGERLVLQGSLFETKLIDSRIKGWNYIETVADINTLLEYAYGFHDSVIKSINYVSGAYVNDDKSMYPSADIRKVTVLLDSQWCESIELVFEGVTALNLRPPADNYMADISGASLFIKNASVFFFDSDIDMPDTTNDGTWISSYSLRWQIISKR